MFCYNWYDVKIKSLKLSLFVHGELEHETLKWKDDVKGLKPLLLSQSDGQFFANLYVSYSVDKQHTAFRLNIKLETDKFGTI